MNDAHDDNVIEVEVPAGCEEIMLINRKNFTSDMNLEFSRLGLKLKGKHGKVVLAGVSGVCQAGQVTAVMGPSGAGKTTFMATLAGKAFYGERTGSVTCNGRDFTPKECKQEVGFVPQEDTMHRFLTVEEVLHFQAELRLPSSWTEVQRLYRVHEVIQLLELEEVRQSQIGDETTRGISGGQRKRVNIGMELVVDPSVLFLDEPTSGLDAAGSLTVVRALKRYATVGRLTVVTVIHQPRYDIYALFDKVLFLEKGGRTVFLGPAKDAKSYFQNELGATCPDDANPADFFMDTIQYSASSSGGGLSEAWENSKTKKQSGSLVRTETMEATDFRNIDGSGILVRHQTGRLAQGVACFRRELTLHYHMGRSLAIDALLFIIGSCTIGVMQANLGAEELSTIGGGMATCVLVYTLILGLQHLRPFGDSKAVVWRDISGGMSATAFFFATNVANLYLIVVSALLHMSFMFPLQGFRASYGQHLVIYIFGGWAITGYAYMVSTGTPPASAQLVITLIVLTFGGLFTGQDPFLADMGPFSLYVLSGLSPQRWMIEAAMQLEFYEQPAALRVEARKVAEEVGWHFQKFDPDTSEPQGDDEIDRKNKCLAILFAIGFCARVVSYILLKCTHRGEQR